MTNRITVVYAKGANVRPAPNINNVPLRTLSAGTVRETPHSETTDADGNRWIQISEAAEYIATFYAGILRATVETVSAPPSGGKTVVEFATLDETEVFVTPPGGEKVKVWPAV